MTAHHQHPEGRSQGVQERRPAGAAGHDLPGRVPQLELGRAHHTAGASEAHSYFSRIARRVCVLSIEQLDRILDQAVANQAISEDDAEDVRQADMVLLGRTVSEGALVYLVVEASATVDEDDVERAARRAAILAGAGLPALAVTAGARITVEGQEAARARDVWRVLDGTAYPPGTPVGAGAA